jgi:hypothetical protein
MRARRFFVILALGALAASAAIAADDANPKISQVSWLTGRWLTIRPAKKGITPVKIQEEWHPARDASMMSVGTTSRGDSILDSELVVIRENGKHLMYEAHPRGQASAVFHSIEVSDSVVVFENPAHDFPQRVGYKRCGPDSLLAWIEGTQKGQQRRIQFPYHRVKQP